MPLVNTVNTSIGPKVTVQGKIEGNLVNLLVDCGSQVTIIPKQYLSKSTRKQIQKPEIPLQAYNGSPISMLGTVNIKLSIGGVTLDNCNVYVGENSVLPVLGSRELLSKGKFSIDSKREEMLMGDEIIKIKIFPRQITTNLTTNNVSVRTEEYDRIKILSNQCHYIPPRTEVVKRFEVPSTIGTGLFYSRATPLYNDLMIGGALNTVSKDRQFIYLPIINSADEPRTLPASTEICEIVCMFH